MKRATILSKARLHERQNQKSSLNQLPPRALRQIRRWLQKQWKRYRKELKRCQRKFSEKAVHNSRVAARRLLATIELLEGFLPPEIIKKARCLIKEHLDIFNDLRDTQVQLVAVTSLQATFPAARAICEWLQKREARLRKQARAGVKRSRPRPLAKLIAASEDAFAKQLKKRSPDAATKLLWRSVNKAFIRTMQFKRRIRAARPKSIHRTRVAFKRFRYMVELLAEHLSADEKMLAEMQHYQTMMGDIQDAEVLLQSFDKFARKKNIRSESANQLREELLRRRGWLINVYMDAAGQLREFWPAGVIRKT
jgi:CHAD domain-containing protein